MRNEGGSATPSLNSAEEDVLQHKDNRLRMEMLPGGACIPPLTGSDNSFISGRFSYSFIKVLYHIALFNFCPTTTVSGHPVLLLPVPKTEPESLSSDETDVSDAHIDGVSTCKNAVLKVLSFIT